MTTDVIEAPIEFERDRDNQAWARWLARSIDALLLTPIVFVLFMALGLAVELGRLPYEFVVWTDNPIAAAIVEVVVMFLLFALWDPLFLSNTGTTPGKWVMGIRVRRADGKYIGLLTACVRFIWVWAIGLGLGIPFVTLICMLIARSKLMTDGVTAWDQGLKLEVTHTKRHPIVWALMIALVVGLTIGFRILNRMSA